MSDLIDRQAAIDMIQHDKIDDTTLELLKVIDGDLGLAVNMACDRHIQGIKSLPSVEPEIVRCKNCENSEHWYGDRMRCFLWHEDGIGVFEDGFCNYAKRRKK